MQVKSLLIITILFLAPVLAIAQIRGTVVGVSDGDTFTLLTASKQQLKIRLHGIDCPEKAQDFGQVAKQLTSDLIFGKIVTVKETDKDRYGRTVGIITMPNGKILNEELLKAGLAWHYIRYDNNYTWSKLETEAKRNKVGLWQTNNAIAPWEWRKLKKLSRTKTQQKVG